MPARHGGLIELKTGCLGAWRGSGLERRGKVTIQRHRDEDSSVRRTLDGCGKREEDGRGRNHQDCTCRRRHVGLKEDLLGPFQAAVTDSREGTMVQLQEPANNVFVGLLLVSTSRMIPL